VGVLDEREAGAEESSRYQSPNGGRQTRRPQLASPRYTVNAGQSSRSDHNDRRRHETATWQSPGPLLGSSRLRAGPHAGHHRAAVCGRMSIFVAHNPKYQRCRRRR